MNLQKERYTTNRSKRKSLPLAVLMLDIDHFKHFNDDFGHDAGDTVLQSLGKLIQQRIRSYDIACRFGGEEFIIILPETNLETSAAIAEDIHNSVRKLNLHHHSNSLGSITVSIGLAIFPQDGTTPHDIIRAVDSALYQAKNSGRNKTIIYIKSQ
jgi:diguanylate cyclase (GGDEF)-like protein